MQIRLLVGICVPTHSASFRLVLCTNSELQHGVLRQQPTCYRHTELLWVHERICCFRVVRVLQLMRSWHEESQLFVQYGLLQSVSSSFRDHQLYRLY